MDEPVDVAAVQCEVCGQRLGTLTVEDHGKASVTLDEGGVINLDDRGTGRTTVTQTCLDCSE